MSDRRKLILDMDVGIDDALMLMHFAAEPGCEIVAIGSTHGNCSAQAAAENAIRVLDVLGLTDVPVALGAESPNPNAVHSAHVHGHDGLGDAGLPAPSRAVSGEHAVDQLIRLSTEQPGEFDLIAVGAMTNLGLALERDPKALTRFRSVWILGGASQRPGEDEPEMFDANIFHNPDAANLLFRSDVPLTVVPIDTSYRAVLSDEHIARIFNGETPAARLAAAILPCYFNFYQHRIGRWTCCAHDPTVSAAFLHPDLITERVERPMIVEPYKDRTRAVGIPDPSAAEGADRPAAEIITGIDTDRMLGRLVDALTLPLGSLPAAF